MNGWKNRETWLVNLWFGDTFICYAENGDTITAEYVEDVVTGYVEDVVTGYVDEIIGAPGFVQDMLDLNAIDYDGLAAHYATEEVVEE